MFHFEKLEFMDLLDFHFDTQHFMHHSEFVNIAKGALNPMENLNN